MITYCKDQMKKILFSVTMLCKPLLILKGIGRAYVHVISGKELGNYYAGGDRHAIHSKII